MGSYIIWHNMLSCICRSIRHHFKCSVDMFINKWKQWHHKYLLNTTLTLKKCCITWQRMASRAKNLSRLLSVRSLITKIIFRILSSTNNKAPDLITTSPHLEQDGILGEELGQVAISKRSDENNVLVLIWVLSLQGTRHHQHWLDRSHAKVVVVLEK